MDMGWFQTPILTQGERVDKFGVAWTPALQSAMRHGIVACGSKCLRTGTRGGPGLKLKPALELGRINFISYGERQ